LAHIHFPATKESAKRLIAMGEDPNMIFMTGCPSIDLLTGDLSITKGFFKKMNGVGTPPDETKPYLVVLQHPVTTEYGSGLVQIQKTIDAIKKLKMPTVWLWPNVDAGSDDISKGLRLFREHDKADYVYFIKNIPPEDYAKMIANCSCIVGNSSSSIRECSFLGTPAVVIGTRQFGREHGKNIITVDYDSEQIFNAIKKQIAHGKYKSEHIFGDGNAGKKIAEILAKVKVKIQKSLKL